MTAVRWREVLREAARNVTTGTTRALIALVAFAAVVGVTTVAQVRGVADVAQQAYAWRAQGSSVQIVQLAGAIDGAQCDALAGSGGIVSSGAVRATAATRLAVLPSTPVETFEVTPGLGRLLGVTTGPHHAPGGVWIAEDLADVVGRSTDTVHVLRGDGSGHDIQVAGVYPYPADGRMPALAYTLLAPVPATGRFDSCWAEVWPENPAAITLLMLSADAPVLDGGRRDAPQVVQLNATAGRAFDASARFAALPLWPLTAAAVVLTAALAVTLVRSRRLELASALHAGIDKPSMLAQLQAETLAWTLTANIVVVPAAWAASVWANPDPAWTAFAPALRTTILALVTAHLATLATTCTLRERHLFRHFRQR
ncbi:hypothetical protein [Xylanimonas protaetiae]|uniref:ABC transporter permease n=1 Tax=Xylanimonas protaetiae TaxID=2509457 RepID=A0A4P6F693_9MICO|nr:hypothetical protein [Xylanimonas protaetiae]QAY71490.1 hypothetical protein ET471_16855 [Xylanimonas protaetiae]